MPAVQRFGCVVAWQRQIFLEQLPVCYNRGFDIPGAQSRTAQV
jgi:hypothetical protein